MTRRTWLLLALAALTAGCVNRLGAQQVFVVYFESGADKLTPEAQQVVAAAATTARNYPPSKITVEGHADGAAADDITLADRRAITVIGALIVRGVDPAKIEQVKGALPPDITGVAAHQAIVRLLP